MSVSLPRSGVIVSRPRGDYAVGTWSQSLDASGAHVNYAYHTSLAEGIAAVSRHMHNRDMYNDLVLWRDGEYLGFFPKPQAAAEKKKEEVKIAATEDLEFQLIGDVRKETDGTGATVFVSAKKYTSAGIAFKALAMADGTRTMLEVSDRRNNRRWIINSVSKGETSVSSKK